MNYNQTDQLLDCVFLNVENPDWHPGTLTLRDPGTLTLRDPGTLTLRYLRPHLSTIAYLCTDLCARSAYEHCHEKYGKDVQCV